MKLFKRISLTLILSLIIYVIFVGFCNNAYAGNYISIDEADRMAPGIKNLANSLKSKHSNYNFQFYNTGLDWNTTILREYQGHGNSPSNLFNFSERFSGMWYCPVCGTKTYDNGTLSCASQDAIRYMMDPRNSLNEDSVFQFKSLEGVDTSYDDIARACIGTFLNNGECVQAILEASRNNNVNAFYLVAKIITEQGKNGSTLSNGVVVNGTRYYNLFNIGAYGTQTQIITNGANYAASQGWNSRRASILGGAQTVKNNYIGKGQNTCYYQKYNVVNTQSGLFSHQYAQNILAAENEGRKFKSNYTLNGNIIGNHTFIIPIYSNMPSSAVARPSTAKKNSITYETGKITANGGVKVREGQGTNTGQIGTIAKDVTVKIVARGSNQYTGYYWDLVISDKTGIYGYVARNYIATTGRGSNSGAASATEYSTQQTVTPQTNTSTPAQSKPVVYNDTGEKMSVKGDNFVGASKITIEEIKSKYPGASILDKEGKAANNICTGYTISIDGKNYVLVKKGDVNGDGEIDVTDVISMLNHIKKTNVISDNAKLEAAKVSGETDVTVTDVVKELNHIKKSLTEILVK